MVSPPHLLPVSALVSKRKMAAWSDGGPGPSRLVEEVMVHTCVTAASLRLACWPTWALLVLDWVRVRGTWEVQELPVV